MNFKPFMRGLLVLMLVISTVSSGMAVSDHPSFSNSEDVWPSFRGDPQNTGFSNRDLSDYDGNILWNLDIGWSYDEPIVDIDSSPVIGENGTIYVGSRDGNIYAVADNGTISWSFETGANITSTPAIADDGTIYVGSMDGYLYALSPEGEERWRKEIGPTHSSPVIGDDGTIYIGSLELGFFALESDGSERWSFESESSIASSPALYQDTVYFGCDAGRLYALNTDNGEESWNVSTESMVRSSPAVVDGIVYIGSDDGNLYAVEGGEIKWEYETGAPVRSSPAVDDDGNIYFGSWSFNVYSLNEEGEERWIFTTEGRVDSSPVVTGDGSVIIGSDDERLYFIGPDGKERWSYDAILWITSSPAVGRDEVIYFTSWYNLYALSGFPTHPENVDTYAGDGYINITWDPPAEDGGLPVTHYNVYRDDLLIAQTEKTWYNDTDLVNFVTYEYYVTAVNERGEGRRSSLERDVAGNPPGPVRSFRASPGTGYVQLNWRLPDDENATFNNTDFYVYRDGYEIARVGSGSYNDTGVQNRVTYHYQVSAFNRAGEGVLSEKVRATPGYRPTEVRELVAQAGDARVDLSWQEPEDHGGPSITHYNVYRDGELINQTEELEFTDTGLQNNLKYTYWVRAENPIGEGESSNREEATPQRDLFGSFLYTILPLILLILILLVGFAVILYRARKKEEECWWRLRYWQNEDSYQEERNRPHEEEPGP